MYPYEGHRNNLSLGTPRKPHWWGHMNVNLALQVFDCYRFLLLNDL